MNGAWRAEVGSFGRVQIDKAWHDCRVIRVEKAPREFQEDLLRVAVGNVLYDFPRSFIKQRLPDEPEALLERIRELERENICDVCAGEGKPLSGLPCTCKGTGKMSESAYYYRRKLVELQVLHEGIEEVLRCYGVSGTGAVERVEALAKELSVARRRRFDTPEETNRRVQELERQVDHLDLRNVRLADKNHQLKEALNEATGHMVWIEKPLTTILKGLEMNISTVPNSIPHGDLKEAVPAFYRMKKKFYELLGLTDKYKETQCLTTQAEPGSSPEAGSGSTP